MGNLLYDIGDWIGFRPYVGGGLGMGWNKWSNVRGGASATFPTGTPLIWDRDSAAFQWQAIGGLSHALGQRVEGFVEYRYIGLANSKFDGAGGAMASRHADRSHNALVGIRYNF
jgi:opacity protein-like surface antigen